MIKNASKQLRSGFTIVELLVVIIVIGILATIAIVSYDTVTNNAKESSYDSTAQQVKLKLGDYYTDNNHYIRLKADVLTYLTSINAGSSIITEFTKADYVYNAYANAAKAACASDAACHYYEITVAKTYWNGGSSDSNLLVTP